MVKGTNPRAPVTVEIPTVVKTMKKYGKEVKIFRSDSETVLLDGDMGKYLEENS